MIDQRIRPSYLLGMAKSDISSETQIHPRIPNYLIELIDQRAIELQEEARKVAPSVVITRNDAVVAILMSALAPTKMRKK